jgi:threonine/homoserine/homoserine lactone efflux protein
MFALSFVVGFSGAMSPGPLTVLTVAETARRGISAPFLIMAGHAGLELVATTALSLGLLAVAGSPRFIGAISLVGGSAMFVLGTMMIRDSFTRPVTVSARNRQAGKGKWRLVGTGIVTSLANPYWTVWWVTVAAGLLVTAAKSGVATVAAFYTGHILADLSYYLALGIAVTAGRKFVGGKIYRWFMALLALTLAVFGVMFALKGWSILNGR